jgi:membrane fusion protein, copper/silver efflux system
MKLLDNLLKSRRALVVLAVVAVGGGFALGALTGGDRHDHGRHAGEATEDDAGRQAVYTCSMHPQVRTTNPKEKCPICGMELIPVPSDDHDDGDADLPRLSVSPRSAALMQVQVWPAERRTVGAPLQLYGRIEADETRLRTVSAWAPGRLERLYVDATGIEVRAGQPMLEIYSPQLVAAQEELLQTVRAVRELEDGIDVVREATELTVEAARERLELLGLDARQIARLEADGRASDKLTIPAPVSGVVVERLAAQGDYVQTGQPIYRLADLSRLWLLLEVYESDLGALRQGGQVRFSTQSQPGREFEGTIALIEPAVGSARTARVRVEIDNPDGRLKPGMFARGTAVRDGGESGAAPLVVPASAPLVTGQRALVYVQDPKADRPTFEAREIELGARAGAWQVVTAGLDEGELVVSHGAFKIDSELQIRGRPSMMQLAGGGQAGHPHGAHGAARQAAPAVASAQQREAPAAFRQQLGALVEANFDLVHALAGDDPAAARRAAIAADAALHAIDGAALPGGAARETWNRASQAMHQAIRSVGDAPDIDRQRQHFEPFSDALTEAVQAFGVTTSRPVYRAMCPMVQGRDGFWLQDQEQIANPYYGAAMLRCGAILEQLAPGSGSGR